MPREYPRGPSGGAVLRGREGMHPEADSAAHGPRGDASADVLARPHRRSPRRRPRTTGRTGPRPPSEPRLSSHLDVGRGGGGGISTPEPTSRRLRPLMTPPACISRSPPRRPRTAPAVFPTSCRPSQTSRRTARRAFRHPRTAAPSSVLTHQQEAARQHDERRRVCERARLPGRRRDAEGGRAVHRLARDGRGKLGQRKKRAGGHGGGAQ